LQELYLALDILNKNTKIWLNYTIGGIISLLLLWGIYMQVTKQLNSIDAAAWKQTGPEIYLWAGLLLMPANVLLEAYKWYVLVKSAQEITYWGALKSYLAGIAFSVITPNRIGEYPGRILYMQRKSTYRLVNVSVLGSVSQLLCLFLFGLAGLIYYNISFPDYGGKIALIACIPATVFIAVLYWRFEVWLPILGRIRWLNKYIMYGRLLGRFTAKRQLFVLSISLLRFAIFTAQYLFLLRWLNVYVPMPEGFLMGSLFFWGMAVVPSIALTEIGERGLISTYLFHHFSQNTVGIMGATLGLWIVNLIIPAIIGSILLFRMRLLR